MYSSLSLPLVLLPFRRIKDQAFGPGSFWVTETRVLPERGGAVLLRGNLRRPGQEAAVFEEVAAAVARLCGEMAAAAGVWQAAGSFWVVGVGCLRWWAPWPGCAVVMESVPNCSDPTLPPVLVYWIHEVVFVSIMS